MPPTSRPSAAEPQADEHAEQRRRRGQPECRAGNARRRTSSRRMMARQTMPIAGVRKISSAGRIEMKAIETPASVPSSAARGVILRITGATKPPTIRMKLWKNTQTSPASQPLIGSPVAERDRQHDHEGDDEHVRHADAGGQRADVVAARLLRERIGEPGIVPRREEHHQPERGQDAAEDDVARHLAARTAAAPSARAG